MLGTALIVAAMAVLLHAGYTTVQSTSSATRLMLPRRVIALFTVCLVLLLLFCVAAAAFFVCFWAVSFSCAGESSALQYEALHFGGVTLDVRTSFVLRCCAFVPFCCAGLLLRSFSGDVAVCLLPLLSSSHQAPCCRAGGSGGRCSVWGGAAGGHHGVRGAKTVGVVSCGAHKHRQGVGTTRAGTAQPPWGAGGEAHGLWVSCVRVVAARRVQPNCCHTIGKRGFRHNCECA